MQNNQVLWYFAPHSLTNRHGVEFYKTQTASNIPVKTSNLEKCKWMSLSSASNQIAVICKEMERDTWINSYVTNAARVNLTNQTVVLSARGRLTKQIVVLGARRRLTKQIVVLDARDHLTKQIDVLGARVSLTKQIMSRARDHLTQHIVVLGAMSCVTQETVVWDSSLLHCKIDYFSFKPNTMQNIKHMSDARHMVLVMETTNITIS
jgi:hypothetical protein